MPIRVTTSANFVNNVKWSGIQHEHDRDKIHRQNVFLNSDRSKYLRQFNIQNQIANYDEIQEEFFGEFVQEHDRKQMEGKTKHPERRYKTVKNFLKAKKGLPYDLLMLKFADKDSWEAFLAKYKPILMKNRGISEKEAEAVLFKATRDGLAKYCDEFNTRKENQNTVMTDYRVDMDEDGAPHVHSRVAPHAHTAGGKVSASLNSALREQFGPKGSNDFRLHLWRAREDKELFRAVTSTIVENVPEVEKQSFEWYRKTEGEENNVKVGISHNRYKAMKQEESLKVAKAKEMSAKLKAKMADLSRLEAEDKLENVQNQINQLKQDSNQWVNETNKKLLNALQVKFNTVKAREDAVKARESKLEIDKQQFKIEKQHFEDHKSTENQKLDDRSQQLDNRENCLKDRESKLLTDKQQFEDRKKVESRKIVNRNRQLDDRETDLNALELGGKDSQGVEHKGLLARKNELDTRESALDDREDSLSNWADDLAETGSTLEKAVQAFTDGFYQGMTNDGTATTEVEELPTLLISSVTHPFAMVAGFRRGIKKLLKVVKENKFLKTLSNVSEHLRLENDYQENLQPQQYNKEHYKGMKMSTKTATTSKQEPKPEIKEKSDDFGPSF